MSNCESYGNSKEKNTLNSFIIKNTVSNESGHKSSEPKNFTDLLKIEPKHDEILEDFKKIMEKNNLTKHNEDDNNLYDKDKMLSIDVKFNDNDNNSNENLTNFANNNIITTSGRRSKNILDLAKRFENKNESMNKNITISQNSQNENNAENKVNHIQRKSTRVSEILNKINNKTKDEEEVKKEDIKTEIKTNSNYVKNMLERINSINNHNVANKIFEIEKNNNTKTPDTLFGTNFNTIEKNDENILNYDDKDNNRSLKGIDKITDDSMIQDFKNLLKFKKKLSDSFDMEYDPNYKKKSNPDLDLYPINSKEVITLEEAQKLKFYENESDKSQEVIMDNEIQIIDDVDEIKNNINERKSIKIIEVEQPEYKGRNSTFKFNIKNSLGKKPFDFKIEENEITTEKNKIQKTKEKKHTNNEEINQYKEILNNNENRDNINFKKYVVENIDESSSDINKLVKRYSENLFDKDTVKSNAENLNEKIGHCLLDIKKNLDDDTLSQTSGISNISVEQRKSVKFYIKKCERAIKKQQSETENKKRRNTHTYKSLPKNKHIFSQNIEEIKEILEKIKLESTENEGDFIEKNKEILKQLGVHEKDMDSIRELNSYIEDNLNKKPTKIELKSQNGNHGVESLNIENFYRSHNEIEDSIKRNTVTNTKRLYDDVSLILEEKDEDSSFINKDRERISDNKLPDRNSNLNIKSLISPINKSEIFPFNDNNNSKDKTYTPKNSYDFNLNKESNLIIGDNHQSVNNFKQESNPFGTNNPNSRETILFNPEIDHSDPNSPNNILNIVSKEKDHSNLGFKGESLKKNENNNHFNNSFTESPSVHLKQDINMKREQTDIKSTKNKDESIDFNSCIEKLNSKDDLNAKKVIEKKLSSNSTQSIKIESTRKTSFKPAEFVIANTMNSKDENSLCFIADEKLSFLNRLAQLNISLKVNLINSFTLEGIKSKNKNLLNVVICKENETIIESNNCNDVTKSSSVLNNNFIQSNLKNDKERKECEVNKSVSEKIYNGSNKLNNSEYEKHQMNIEVDDSIILKNSKYKKNILNNLDNIAIAKYEINMDIPLDPTFYDILCINCYECVKLNEVDFHSEYCIIKSEEKNDIINEEEDYNSKIYKLHCSLKNKTEEIENTNNPLLNKVFDEMLDIIYEILINNNSIEELDKSIFKFNEIINNEINKISSKFKITLMIYGKRISQLVFLKLNNMEKILDLIKEQNRNYYQKSDNTKLDESDLDLIELENEENRNNEEEDSHFKFLQKELAALDQETVKSKLELEKWKQEAKLFENMMKRPNTNYEILSDINSDVQNRKDESFDALSIATGQTSDYDQGDVGNMRDVNEVLEMKSEDDLKKYFLSIGLAMIFKYSDKLKNNLSISDLYDEARAINVPIGEWYNFIVEKLKNNL